MRKIVSLLLAAMMLLGLVPAIAETPASTLEPVTLEWYVAEDSQPDNATVFAALNEYFQKTINTTINFHFVPYSEYAQKVGPMLDTNQNIDIVNANGAINYVDYAKKGAFADITELVKEYAPETYAMIPEGYWDAMVIDGSVYGIPSYKDSCQMFSMHYNATMAEDLGMDMGSVVIDNAEDIIPLLYQAKELRDAKYPEMADLPITRCAMEIDRWRQNVNINSFLSFNVPGVEGFSEYGDNTVFCKYMTKEYREMSKTVAQMVDDGLFPYDLFNYDTSRVYDKEGKYFFYDIGSGYVTVSKDHNGTAFDTAMIPFSANIGSTNYLHNAVECISAASQNKERAMMVLEMLNTDPYVVTTLRFGVEGEHYNVGADGILDFTGTKNDPALGSRGHYYWYGAQFGSFVKGAIPAGYPANFFELIEQANQSAITDTNMGFIFDATPVQNEVAACSAVVDEFTLELTFGYIELEDVDARIDEFVAKMQANGIDKVVAEAQAQLDAFRAAQGK